MTLCLSKSEKYDVGFIVWLVKNLKLELIKEVKKHYRQLKRFNAQVYEQKIFYSKNILDNPIDFVDVLVYGIKRLDYIELKDTYIIYFNMNKVKYPNYNVYINTLFNFVNCGGYTISGVNIVSKVFSNVEIKLDTYIYKYMTQVIY